MGGALKAEFLPIAERVASSVRGRLPRRSGKAQASVKARSSNYGASVAAGGRAAEYYPWLDFGGSVGRGHQEGRAWSGAIKRAWMGVPTGAGRYLYPAISDNSAETAEAALEAVEGLARRAGFEVRG